MEDINLKFLFISPRFHTNQFHVSKSLTEANHKVEIWVQYFNQNEDYSIIKPYILQKSFLSKFLFKLFDLIKCDSITIENARIKYFIPSIYHLYKQFKRYRPDIVILRNRNFTSMFAYFICQLIKVKAIIIYNQTSLYTNKTYSEKNKIKKYIQKFLFPKVRITPVYTNNILALQNNFNEYFIEKHDYFVPFVADVNKSINNRNYCLMGK